MGKKDKKDAVKVEAKKNRVAKKQDKASAKRTKKELKTAGEADIESIIAEFSAKDAARMAVEITPCVQPTRRSGFTMTGVGNHEMVMFGGEFCDGERIEVYNELFRWNVEKNDWKQIESLNTPPPRCSHQIVPYMDKLYMFGGEYATMHQFYHYRDFWELDLKTNTWTEIQATGDIPSARSGHRMVIWRNYLILFGGFYEAARDSRWYNDLYFYSFPSKRWTKVEYKPNTQVPKPRSGVQMFVHGAEDNLYVLGGYSKEKNAVSKMEGKIHNDLWMISLKPALQNSKTAPLDFNKISWQKISRKGDFPSPRCGSAVVLFKMKALVFGGVFDQEGPRHSLESIFYDDLLAFDMEKRRFYKLGIKKKKEAGVKGPVKELEGGGDESDAERDEDDDDEANEYAAQSRIAEEEEHQKEMFGYIDESGAVVYIDANEFNESEAADGLSASIDVMVISEESANAVSDISAPIVVEDIVVATVPEPVVQIPTPGTGKNVVVVAETEKTPEVGHQTITQYFQSRTSPCPRINPCLIVKGNTLILFGGVTEIGDIEVTLDDCWSLDLNKRDTWKKVLPGTMETLVWKGEDEDDASSMHSSVRHGDSDDDDDEDDDDDDDDSELDEDDEEEEDEEESGGKRKRDDKKDGKKDKKDKKDKKKSMSRREELQLLQEEYDLTDSRTTPLDGETLREFYSRTSEYWASEVIRMWHENNVDVVHHKSAELTEKEIKREGFLMAEKRYQKLLPILQTLHELELEQEQAVASKPKASSKKR